MMAMLVVLAVAAILAAFLPTERTNWRLARLVDRLDQ